MVKSRDKRKIKGKKRKGSAASSKAISKSNSPIIRFIFGSLFGLLALFTFVSLISYLFTWAEDQSILTDDNFITSVISAKNLGGKLGFVWSNFLISKLFGLGAFVIPFFLAGVSIYCFRKGKINLVRLFFLSLMGAIVLSVACSFIFSFTSAKTLFGEGAGGSYGYYLNEWLVAMTGKFGAGIIIFFFLLLWVILLDIKIIKLFTRRFNSLFSKSSETEEIDEIDAAEFPESNCDKSDEDSNLPEPEFEIAGSNPENEENLNENEKEDEDEENEEKEGEKHCKWRILGRIKKQKSTTETPAPPTPSSDPIEQDPQKMEPHSEESETFKNKNIMKQTQKMEPRPEESPVDSDDAYEIPPVEIIQGDASDFSNVLSDREWKNKYDPRLSLSNYTLPDISLLDTYSDQANEVSREELENNNRKIVAALRNYKIGITKISARIGPTVTLYEIVPAPGIRVSQIKRLEEDIALSLAARGVRVVTLAGTNAIGIEVANEKASIVSMRSVLSDPKFNSVKYDLPVAMGRTISNEVMLFDLARMPHLLVAGATGQGKSVCLNAIITSLLFKKHPSELKFVLVDPKKVELSPYEPLEKHYLAKLPDAEDAIITDTKLVIYTLKSLCKLMDRRYDLLKMASVRNIKEYNEKFLSRKLNPYKGHEFMPYIVVIIDEFADLLITAGREVEEPMTRLAQLARAIGIHLVIATQRPTTNIITGTIKANFPARIAFRVISSIDSKTILDQTGANQLVGRGDMLISTGSSEPVRVQCAFIDTPEVYRVSQFIKNQPGFGSAYLLPEYVPEEGSSVLGWKTSSCERDDLFKEAARLIVREQQGSTSLIQRKMNLGYNRAGRIMDQLEDVGIVGPPEGSKPRQVRITSSDSLEEILANL